MLLSGIFLSSPVMVYPPSQPLISIECWIQKSKLHGKVKLTYQCVLSATCDYEEGRFVLLRCSESLKTTFHYSSKYIKDIAPSSTKLLKKTICLSFSISIDIMIVGQMLRLGNESWSVLHQIIGGPWSSHPPSFAALAYTTLISLEERSLKSVWVVLFSGPASIYFMGVGT